jgi:hypothetical protein
MQPDAAVISDVAKYCYKMLGVLITHQFEHFEVCVACCCVQVVALEM